MVNYLVFSLASISILATAFPSPGHVSEITYRLFGQLPRLAARSTSFLFPFLSLLPSPFWSLCFFFSFFSFLSLVGPFTGKVGFLTCPFVQLPKTVYGFEVLRERSWISTQHVRFLSLSTSSSLSFFFFSFAHLFGLKRHDCWLFLLCSRREFSLASDFSCARLFALFQVHIRIFRLS